KGFNAGSYVLCRADRGQSSWDGRGRPSKRPELTAMRAAHLAATRAARVMTNAIPGMSSILWLVFPTLDQISCCIAAKTNNDSFRLFIHPVIKPAAPATLFV